MNLTVKNCENWSTNNKVLPFGARGPAIMHHRVECALCGETTVYLLERQKLLWMTSHDGQPLYEVSQKYYFMYSLPAGLPRSGKLPVLFLLTGQKSDFSPRRGDSLHRFRSSFAEPTGTWVRLAVQNFTSIGSEGWECGPQNIKIFHFSVKSRPAGATPLTDFEKFLGAFLYDWLSYVSVSNFMWFASQVTGLLRRNRASVN